jgi:anion-transporting  ArsA/GET3 family ATPase
VIVCGPQAEPIEEAVFFHSKLIEAGMSFGGAIVNRVRYSLLDPVPPEKELVEKLEAAAGSRDLAGRAAENLIEYGLLAERDEDNIEQLRSQLSGEPVIRVPYLDTDVHDIEGLAEINRFLFADERTRVDRAT